MVGYVLIQSMPDHLPYIVMISLPGFPFTLAFTMMGCCLGAASGIVQRDWRRLKRLTLRGLLVSVFINMPFIPRFRSLGFSGMVIKSAPVNKISMVSPEFLIPV